MGNPIEGSRLGLCVFRVPKTSRGEKDPALASFEDDYSAMLEALTNSDTLEGVYRWYWACVGYIDATFKWSRLTTDEYERYSNELRREYERKKTQTYYSNK